MLVIDNYLPLIGKSSTWGIILRTLLLKKVDKIGIYCPDWEDKHPSLWLLPQKERFLIILSFCYKKGTWQLRARQIITTGR